MIIHLAIWDLKQKLVNRKKKSFFVMGTLKNNSTPAGDFTGYYMSWVAPFGNWPVALN